jgi:hypothetical protein
LLFSCCSSTEKLREGIRLESAEARYKADPGALAAPPWRLIATSANDLSSAAKVAALRYQQLITVAVVRGFAQLQKFVAAIALEVGAEKLGSGNLSFHSLWYPIVPRISDNHFASAANCVMWG